MHVESHWVTWARQHMRLPGKNKGRGKVMKAQTVFSFTGVGFASETDHSAWKPPLFLFQSKINCM